MIEIEFDSMEDAAEAVKELSYLGKARIDKRIHQDVSRKLFLNSTYEKALEQLKKAEKIFEEENLDDENDENLVEYLSVALTVLKKLFETEKFRELDNNDPIEVENKLLEIVSEMDFDDTKVTHRFGEYEKIKKEAKELYENMIKLSIEKLDHLEDVEESDSPVSGKPDEVHHSDPSKEEESFSEDDIVYEDGSDSLPPGAKYFNKLFEMKSLKQYMISPIIESVLFHMDSEDPYSSFIDSVYLNIGKLPDLFEATDFRIRLMSNIHMAYFLTAGIEFVLHMQDFERTLSELPVVNEDVFEHIKMVSVIVDLILSALENYKKVKYGKFILDINEKINDEFFCLQDLDVEFNVDSDFIELIIKDLARIGFIKTKGKKIIKYAGK